jgi:hypothetical protein
VSLGDIVIPENIKVNTTRNGHILFNFGSGEVDIEQRRKNLDFKMNDSFQN